jgi:hypothetical protein
MWEAIGYVSSGLTLVAFLAAVLASSYKSKVEERERLIRTASPEKRADLVQAALEFFHVDTGELTKEQQYKIAIEQIRARAQRFRLLVLLIGFLAIIAASVAAYAISKSGALLPLNRPPTGTSTTEHPTPQPPPTNSPAPPKDDGPQPISVLAKPQMLVGVFQPFDSSADNGINRLSVSVTARPGGRGTRYQKARLTLNFPGVPPEQKVKIVADVSIDGSERGCATLRDTTTGEYLFEECKESRRIVLSLRNQVAYEAEVNASATASAGQTVSRKTAVEFATLPTGQE